MQCELFSRFLAIAAVTFLLVTLPASGLAQKENPPAGKTDSVAPTPRTDMSKSESEEIVKLKAVEWQPRAIDVGPGGKADSEPKWQAKISTIEIASPKDIADVAQKTTEAELEAKRSSAIPPEEAPPIKALGAWENAGKKLSADIANQIQSKIEEYRTALIPDVDVPAGAERQQRLESNFAAQKTIKDVVKEKETTGKLRPKEVRLLKSVQDALVDDEKQIRQASPRSAEAVAPATRYFSTLHKPGALDEKVVANFAEGEVVAPKDSLPEAARQFYTAPAPTSVTPLDLHYASQGPASDGDADRDLIKSKDVSVAIRTVDRKLAGTGILLGRNLILTCGHLFENEPEPLDVSKYQVVSDQDYGRTETETHFYPLGQRVVSGKLWPISKNTLDYALFEVGPDSTGTYISSRVRERRKIDLVNFRRGSQIYVVGYTEGKPRGRTEGSVVYSYRAIRNGVELLNFFHEAIDGGATQSPESFINNRWAEYDGAYRKDGGHYYYLVRLVGRSGTQPVFGAECNEYPGNSGSPVYSKKRRQLIGLLLGGSGNGPTRPNATWADMEFVLPFAPIVEQLDKDPGLPDWQERYDVQIIRPNNSASSLDTSPSLANQHPLTHQEGPP